MRGGGGGCKNLLDDPGSSGGREASLTNERESESKTLTKVGSDATSVPCL